ncbi:MAG: DegV family protein [Bacillaceae bacterium]
MTFILATDSDSDIPLTYAQEHDIYVFSVPVKIEELEFEDDLGKTYSHHDFYNKVRRGSMPTTSQINIYTFQQQFEKWAQEGKEVLYIAFSSALSGIYNSAMSARAQVLEQYPEASITVIDSLCASGGEGLLVYYANEMRLRGKCIGEVAQYIESIKGRIFQMAMVEDLNHLVRGGRVTPIAGFVGSLLQLKPILCVSEEGKITPYQKARGSKKAIRILVDHYQKYKTDETDVVFITHADCEEGATMLANSLKDTCGVKEVIVTPLGPGIGSHTGADTIAICFLAKEKYPI